MLNGSRMHGGHDGHQGHVRLARREEREVRVQFGEVWDRYAARTPGFIPHLSRPGADIDQKRTVHP